MAITLEEFASNPQKLTFPVPSHQDTTEGEDEIVIEYMYLVGRPGPSFGYVQILGEDD